MKFEPLLYFSELYGPDGEIFRFAEYDESVNNKFMATYHFTDVNHKCDGIRSIWFDFYKEKYFLFDIQFNEETKALMTDESYIDICYQFGGTVLAWIVSPKKSRLIGIPHDQTILDEKKIGDIDVEWLDLKYAIQKQFDLKRGLLNTEIDMMSRYTKSLMHQYKYRYIPFWGLWNKETGRWIFPTVDEILQEVDFIEEALYDGTHDKMHNDELLNYHKAGKPQKIAIHWHFKKNKYSAYFWFDYNAIRSAYEAFFSQNPEAEMDFIFLFDVENNIFQLAFYYMDSDSLMLLNENSYQMIVFKNKFENYRTPNYNQPRGAWIW